MKSHHSNREIPPKNKKTKKQKDNAPYNFSGYGATSFVWQGCLLGALLPKEPSGKEWPQLRPIARSPLVLTLPSQS
nr:hypothetical protein [Helianthus tuberosus]